MEKEIYSTEEQLKEKRIKCEDFKTITAAPNIDAAVQEFRDRLEYIQNKLSYPMTEIFIISAINWS